MPAKKHINLIPKEDFERTTLGRIMKWALTSFRFIVIVVEFIVIAGFLFRFYLDVQINSLDDEINQKSALISSKSVFEKDFRDVQQKAAIYAQITSEGNQPDAVLQEVVRSLPSDTQIISFSKESSSINITAATLNETSISAFIANLEDKEGMQSVSLIEISSTSGPLIEFGLSISLAPSS